MEFIAVLKKCVRTGIPEEIIISQFKEYINYENSVRNNHYYGWIIIMSQEFNEEMRSTVSNNIRRQV